MTGQHLTDEQFAELLASEGTVEATNHVLKCALCRQELLAVQSSLQQFSSHSLEWAEERASSSILAPSTLLRDWQITSAFAAVAATLLAAALLAVQGGQRTPGPAMTASSPVVDSDAQVATDNRLLMSIDQEIRWQAEAPISVQDLTRLPN